MHRWHFYGAHLPNCVQAVLLVALLDEAKSRCTATIKVCISLSSAQAGHC